jgi:LysM repeat protein
VQPGDSLSVIAERFDVRIEDLIALNGITNPDQIQAGQKLQIPPPTILVTGNDGTATSSDQVP